MTDNNEEDGQVVMDEAVAGRGQRIGSQGAGAENTGSPTFMKSEVDRGG